MTTAGTPVDARSRTGSRPPLRRTGGDLLVLLVVALGTLALSKSAIFLAPEGSATATWWPAAGFGVAAAVVVSRRRVPLVLLAVLVGSVAGNLVGGRLPTVAVLFSLANTVEVAVSYWVLTARDRRARLDSLADLVRLAAAVLAGAVAVGVLAGGVVAVVLDGSFLATAPSVATSHAAAQFLVVPVALTWRTVGGVAPLAERLTQAALLVGSVALVFGAGLGPLPFLPLVPLVWAAARMGPRAVSIELLGCGVAVTVLTASGRGPFASGAGTVYELDVARLVQVFVVAAALVVLPLAVSVAERARAHAEVQRSEALFRGGFTDALLGMVLLHRRGDSLVVVEANREAEAMLGDVRGTPWCDRLQPHDRDLARAAAMDLVSGRTDGWRHEVQTVDEPPRWFEVALSLVGRPSGADGEDAVVAAQLVDVTSRREAEMQLARLALFDELTGLPNRVLLRDRLDQALARAQREERGPALLFCDLDDFKQINDTDGHAAGDVVLAAVAERLRACVRAEDTVARLGGDEFVVLCPDADEVTVRPIAERIVDAVTAPMPVAGRQARVRVSVGVVVAGAGSTAETMLRDADTAMYAAKYAGKGRFVVFDDEHRTRAVRLVRLAEELRHALGDGQLALHVQPVVDLVSGRVVAGEALLRWQHPLDGLRMPGEWLDVAESSGLMPEIGRWVLEEACRTAAGWRAALGHDAPRVHVNVSARQLDRDEDLAATVIDVLERTGLPGPSLVLELTETGFEAGRGRLAEHLVRLRAAGVGVAVDDLGAGYSSLSRLVDLPVDMVKVDRGFVAAMVDDPRALAVVQTVLALGRAIGTHVVAEGVETHEQAALLEQLGCRLGQGYLWSPAQPPRAFLDHVRARELLTR